MQDGTTDQVGSVRDGSFAAALWSLTLGSGVIVAVVDTGIDARQPDLSTHLWQNPNPLPGGVDQEGVSFLPKLLSPPNLLASTMSGTSMAAPMVSGVAALLFALYPQATAADVAAALCAGVRPEPALARLTRCGGTLDALAAARMLGAALGQPQPEIP